MDKIKKIYQKNENIILTGIFFLVLCGLIARRYDYYYDLNDDVLMKDILAGVYTGEPEGHNIQMLYPLSALISLLYRLVPAAPWYGLFLCLCQYGSIGAIVHRGLRLCRNRPGKGAMLLTAGIIVTGTMLEHLIFVQYTITATMLAAAAVFLFLTSGQEVGEKGDSAGEHREKGRRAVHRRFFRQNIPAVLLVWLAFLIRSEMLLLVLPLIGVAGIYKWAGERPVFTKTNCKKYLAVAGAVLIGLALGLAIHAAAYSAPEWREFTAFFDHRTQLYDYQQPPQYQEHMAFYDRIGLSESEAGLLDNYNFGLEEEIDAGMMGEIAAYAVGRRREEKPFKEQIVEKVKLYYYKMTHVGKNSDFPWNALILVGYAGLLGVGINRRKTGGMCLKLFLLAGVRTALWMYILMVEREPPRISHSLYYMEFCILCGMMLMSCRPAADSFGDSKRRPGRYFPILAGGLMVITAGINVPVMVKAVEGEAARREEINRPWLAMQEYASRHPDNYYYLDVYTTVAYSEKMFAGVNNRPANYDFMGGWACKSPLYEKKTAYFLEPLPAADSIDRGAAVITMDQALLTREDVYMIIEKGGDRTWLEDFYRDQGVGITVTFADIIADKMEVYKIRWDGQNNYSGAAMSRKPGELLAKN